MARATSGGGGGGGHSQAGAESLVAKISSVAELCACAMQRMLRAVVGVARWWTLEQRIGMSVDMSSKLDRKSKK